MAKPKGKKQVKITILYGLPGSGKTYFAQKERTASVIDLDAIAQKIGTNRFLIMNELSKQVYLACRQHRTNSIIIDGLVTTNQQLRDIMDVLAGNIDQYQLIFELVYWKEDRDACLHNDKNRREVSSEISIKNMPYETPDIQSFPELTQKRVTVLKVVRKSPALTWVSGMCRKMELSDWRTKQIAESMTLQSESWCLGGTWGSYTGDSGTVEAETPREFDEFDQLLEAVCPDISFLGYKKLKSKCCRLETKSSGDYYGGHTSNAYHVCDLQMLYTMLLDMKLIEE